MSPSTVLPSQPAEPGARADGLATAGSWKVAPGRAISLRPRQRGVLEIAQGRAWVTIRSHRRWPGRGRDAGSDWVLQPGDRLVIEPGQHAVVEAWGGAPQGALEAAEAMAFRWDIAPATSVWASAASHRCADAAVEWRDAVVQPLHDLGQALAQGGRAVGRAVADAAAASGRLLWGMGRFVVHRVAAPWAGGAA